MSDLLSSSAATWSDHAADAPVVDPRLRPPVGASAAERLSAWRVRHHLRRDSAEQVYRDSRFPERGWPVAGDRVVFRFFRDLVLQRRGMFTALVLFNALAAGLGLVVPELLGDLVGLVEEGRADSGRLTDLALLVVGVVLAQALMTFFAQRTSTLFGQDLLASAREYVVRTILRLPLGQVESASTGDLVTRVTRDVGTMSRAVQFGLPMAIISLLTVVLSVVAMLANSLLLAVPSLLVIGSSYFAVRNYLRRAPKGYIAEGSTYSRINTTLTETVEGARTVEALRLSDRRVRQGDDNPAGPPAPPGGSYPDVPVLVLSGELDSITTPAEGALVVEQFPGATQVVVPDSFHVTALADTDGCASDLVREFTRRPHRPPASCAGRTTRVDAPGIFPRSVADLGRRRTVDATVADVIDRWWNNYSGRGVGLRGGTWRYAGSKVVRFRLDGVRLVDDLAVTGRVVWDRYAGTVTSDVTATGR